MASYKNFQRPNNNNQGASRVTHNPAFNATVKSKTTQQEDFLTEHVQQYSEFISWCRWYPDLFLDLIRPRDKITRKPIGGIHLHFDQRVFLRSVMRFRSMYGVFTRRIW